MRLKRQRQHFGPPELSKVGSTLLSLIHLSMRESSLSLYMKGLHALQAMEQNLHLHEG